MTTTKLPFDLSVESTANWLQSLSQFNSTNSANQLNKALLQLRKINKEPDKILSILLQLTPAILYIADSIEATILAETKAKTSNKSGKIGQLCIQLLRNLSLAFCYFTDKELLATEKTNHAIYFSLQLIGYTQRITTIFHQFPSTKLWKTSGDLYILAQKRDIVNQEIKHKIRDFKNLNTIDSVIKRNLLFTIISPYQYKSHEIKELFVLSEQHAHLLELSPKKSVDHPFFWDPKSDSIPGIKNNSLRSGKVDFNINISTGGLLARLHSKTFTPNPTIKTILANVIEQLNGFQTLINTASASKLLIYHIIVGYTEIITHLEKTGMRDKIEQFSSQLDKRGQNSQIIIQPKEFEKNYADINILPPSRQVELPKNAQAVKIQPTSYNQYIIAIANSIACTLGDLVLLYHSNFSIELGIVRQIKIDENTNYSHILLEKMSGKPVFRQIDSPKIPEKQAILMQKNASKAELFMHPCKLYNGTVIKFASEQTVTIDDLIDHNPYFMHYILT